MAERIDRRMYLDALFTLSTIVASTCVRAAGHGLNGATIDDDGG